MNKRPTLWSQIKRTAAQLTATIAVCISAQAQNHLPTTGNVGIGIGAPIYPLDIRSTLPNNLHVSGSGNDDGGYFGSNGNTGFWVSNSAFNGTNWIAKGPTSATMVTYLGDFLFYSNTGLTSGSAFTPTTRMILTNAGYVGIGTSSPTAFLNITAPTTSAASLRLQASSAVNPTAPNIGDLWFNGTNLNFRKNGSTTVDLLNLGGTLSSTLAAGNTTGGTNIAMTTGDKIVSASDVNQYISLGNANQNIVIETDGNEVHIGPNSAAFAVDGGGFVLGKNGVGNGVIQFNDNSSVHNFTIQGPSRIATSFQWFLPNAQGSAGTVLTNDGAGNLSWAALKASPPLIQNQIAFGDASNLMTSSPNLIFHDRSYFSVTVPQFGINTSSYGDGLFFVDGSPGNGIVTIGDYNGDVNANSIAVDDVNQNISFSSPVSTFYGTPAGGPFVAINVVGATPTANLQIGAAGHNSTFKYIDGNQSAGKILTSDASGNATWQAPGNSSGWTLTGNSGTVDGTNFIGTTDNVPLTFEVGDMAGRLDPILENSYFGYQAGTLNNPASQNTFIGQYAGYNTCTGRNCPTRTQPVLKPTLGSSQNTFIGYLAGVSNITGTGITILGSNAGVGSDGISFATAIGAGAIVNQSNSLVLGASGTNVGIGTTAPGSTLEIDGVSGTTLKIVDGNQASGKVLTVNRQHSMD